MIFGIFGNIPNPKIWNLLGEKNTKMGKNDEKFGLGKNLLKEEGFFNSKSKKTQKTCKIGKICNNLQGISQ